MINFMRAMSVLKFGILVGLAYSWGHSGLHTHISRFFF